MERRDDDDDDDNNGANDGDEDFNVDDYREDVDSDESYETLDENDKEIPEEEYSGPILPGGHRFDRKLLCVKYPGIVENVDKAIETLGGLSGISVAHDTPNRRMELRFRPQDGYCKPTCGERHETASFLVRVRVKKSRVQQMSRNESEYRDNLDFKGPYDLAELERMLGSLGRKLDETGKMERNVRQKNEEERNAFSFRGVKIESETNVEDRGASKISEKSVTSEEKKVTSNDAENNGYRDSTKDEDYRVPSAKVIGRVETAFDFQNLCDFQYLAIGKSVTDPKVEEYIYDSVYPVEIPPYRWLKSNVPAFLPPSAFSRTDTVQHLSLKVESDKGPQNVIGTTRKRLVGFSNFINFDSPETPCAPPPGIETALRTKFLQKSHLERMRQKFEERPVWTKNALMCVTNFTSDQLRFLLPSIAYYFMTGPWRIMWVKLGYDPRKDPQARMYQNFDYRCKVMHGLQFTVNRRHATSESKSTPGVRSRTTILTSMQEQGASRKGDQLLNETTYIYREGVVPPWRQMFYQYCDIHVPEIQGMLAKLPDHLPPGVKCHEKRGWLPIGFSDQCREIINRQVRAVLRKQMNIPEDHPTALPPKRGFKSKIRSSGFAAHELPKNRTKKKRKEAKIPERPIEEPADPTKKS